MIKLYYQVHSCSNYFDDIVCKRKPRNVENKQKKSYRTKTSGKRIRLISKIYNYKPNPNRIQKVFIQISDVQNKPNRSANKRSSLSSSWSSSSSNGRIKQPLDALKIESFTLELCGRTVIRMNNKTKRLALMLSEAALHETFFFATLYRASFSYVGTYYELTKESLQLNNNRFMDKYHQYETARMSYFECFCFLHLTVNILATITLLVVRFVEPYQRRGLFIYSVTAIIGCIIVSSIHLLSIYAYKSSIKRWMSLNPIIRKRNQTTISLCVTILAISIGKFYTINYFLYFLFSFKPFFSGTASAVLQYILQEYQKKIWLIGYLISIVLFLLTAICIWYIIAIMFNYFKFDYSYSTNQQFQKAFDQMLDNLVINPSYEQKTLAQF